MPDTQKTNVQNTEKIIPRLIEQEMRTSYLDYSMSVIVGRALPDVRDGLKPVHRRVLYGMYEMGVMHNKPFKKSARIVGDVMGKYHPHGDSAIYDTMVRMAQDFSLRYPLVFGQGNFGCFTKETKVRLTDGRALSFGELEEEHKQGKTNFTFTVKDDGTIAIAQIINPRLTKENAALVKVVLDNGEEIKCTADHRFMMLDGTYKEAQYLTPSTSLMPGYFRLSTKQENPEAAGYELIYQPSSKNWTYSHHLADEWNIDNSVYSLCAGRVRHHVDFNKFNNNPTNIQRLHWGAHLKLHSQHASTLHQSADYREKIAQGREQYWSNPAVRESYAKRMSERNKERWQDPTYREQMSAFLSEVNKKHIAEHPEKREEFSKRATATLKLLWKDPAYKQLFHQKIAASNKKRTTNNTGKSKFIRICHEALAQHRMLTQETYESIREEQFGKGFTTWETGIRKYFSNDVEAIYAEVCHNHKVSHVEKLSQTADVYDLTVNDTHNFLLEAGVFVHNSVDGDNAAAMRYTEARLAKFAEELLQDIDKETVDFVPNYDASLKEPSVLPSKAPNLLLNGSSGIAVGMATSIPPHNMNEVCDGVIATLNKPDIDVIGLMQTIKAPDFPTGGIIMGTSGLLEAYKTGKGKITVRAKTHLEEGKTRQHIVIDEIPYLVNKAMLIENIAELVNDKKIQGIADVRDESDRDGMRVVIDLKQGANSDVILNQLFAHTRMQETFSINMLALVGNQPRVLPLKDIITEFVAYRKQVVRKRTQYDLTQASDKAHLLEGLIVALDHIDAIVKLIKESKSADDAKKGLMQDYQLSEKQAQAILDMTLRRLTSLEQAKIRAEHQDLVRLIKDLKDILANEQKIIGIIKAELLELKEKYGDERQTQIIETELAEMADEELIRKEDVVITITHAGYVKRLPMDTYKQQRRGGKGIIAAETKEDDFIEHLFVANTHNYLMCFTNKGRVHWIKVYQLPEAGRYAKGTAIVNILQLQEGEKVSAFIPVEKFDPSHYLFMVTKQGTVKKTSLEEFSNPRKGGIIALTLDEGDELRSVMLTSGKSHIIIATEKGMAIRFEETKVRSMGRSATGVIGIKLRKDAVVGATIADEKQTILTVTEKGYGKRTAVNDYRITGRGGVGVINIKITDKNGKVVGIQSITDTDEIMLISHSGTLIRIPASGISVIGRNTQGVRVMKLDDKDTVISIATIAPEND